MCACLSSCKKKTWRDLESELERENLEKESKRQTKQNKANNNNNNNK